MKLLYKNLLLHAGNPGLTILNTCTALSTGRSTKSYLVTLECYSVIEEWVHKADPIKRSSWKVQLKNAQSDMDTDRNKLVKAIIDLL